MTLLLDGVGAERAGLFFFATTLTGYFAGADLAVGISVTKYVAELRAGGDTTGLNSLLRGALLTMGALGLLTGAVVAVFAYVGPPLLFDEPEVRNEATPALLVVALSAIPYWISRLGVAALNGLERYDLSSAIGIGSSLLLIAGFVVLLEATKSVAVLTAFFVAVTIGEGMVSAAFAWPGLGLRRRTGRWWGNELRPVVALGGAMFLIGISDTLMFSFDRAIVAAFAGSAAIVLYEIALRPHNAIRAVSSLAGSALISTSSRLVAQGRHSRVRELVLTGSFINVVGTLPIVVAFILLAEPVISLWVGAEYSRYAVYAQIFASYWLVGCNVGVLGSVVTGRGQMGVFARIQLTVAVISLGLSVALTAAWGVVGVIWGTVIPAWISAPIWVAVALRQLDISFRDYLRHVVGPAYGMTAGWTLALIAVSRVLDPDDPWQLFAITLLAAGGYAILVIPMVRRRWREAVEFI